MSYDLALCLEDFGRWNQFEQFSCQLIGEGAKVGSVLGGGTRAWTSLSEAEWPNTQLWNGSEPVCLKNRADNNSLRDLV